MLGFGRPVAEVQAAKHPNFDLAMQFFHQSIAMVADGLGAPLERIEQTVSYGVTPGGATIARSEEHTSELQSLMRISYAVFCLKKKTQKIIETRTDISIIKITNTDNYHV